MTQSVADPWSGESSQTAIDDPVPGWAESGLYGGRYESPHELEMRVQRALLSMAGVEFASLNVNRLADGVCLTGVVRVPEATRPQFERVAAMAAGVSTVLNHLVVQKCGRGQSIHQ